MNSDEYILGIDLGGTNIRLGEVDSKGILSNFHMYKIDRSLTGDELIDWIGNRVEETFDLERMHAVGVGLAAMVLRDQRLRPGLVVHPGLAGYPFVENLSQRINTPCWVGNDASAALRGEVHFGSAKGYKNVLLLTLGTGIGGGLLLNGKVREGSNGSSVEIGLLKFGYPSQGDPISIESLYSPGAIMEQLGDPYGNLFERVEKGISKAKLLESQMYKALGLLIANVHLLLDLELILLSGGVVQAGDKLIDGIRREFRSICPTEYQFGLDIRPGNLQVNTAGVIGAASVWLERASLLPSLTLEENL